MSATSCIIVYLGGCFIMWDFVEVEPLLARFAFIVGFLGSMIMVKV